MGAFTYYHFRAQSGRNAETPWAIAYNAGSWQRSLNLRGWSWKREVYCRPATPAEDEKLSKMMRCYGGRYENLEKLLEDEREILGADSDEYRELESALNKYEEKENMTTRTKTKGNITKVLPLKSTAKKAAKNNENIPAETNGNGQRSENQAVGNPDIYKIVPRTSIEFSKTNPRKTFTEVSELAESIRAVGILEPLLVIRSGDGYELIAGERRLRAAEIAGLDDIPVIIKDVSGDKLLEIQIIENLQRKEVHPLEEADGYEYLKTKLNYTDEEIALRVGKPTVYIAYRLKLKNLNETARKYFAENKLMLSHALEIAKYPVEAQNEILNYAFNNFGYTSESLFPMPKFLENIQKHFLLSLKQAPFSTKSKELRPDGLACVDCNERTKASLLFTDMFDGKDNCLNRECWKGKTANHIQIQRRKTVETDLQITDPKKAEKAAVHIPLISESYYVNDSNIEDVKKKHPFFKNSKFLTSSKYEKVSKNDDCGKSTYGFFFDGSRIGQKEKICIDPNCKVHLGKYSSNGQTIPTEVSRESRMIRKEEIFDSRTAETTRRRVLKQVAEKFDDDNTIYTHEDADFYQIALLARLWKLQIAYSEHTAKIILEILGLEKDALGTSRWNDDSGNQVANLSPGIRARLLFLLLVADKGEIFEAYWAYKSQKEIKDLAEKFAVNYKLIDAQERLALAPMKQKDLFRDYLAQIEAGDKKAKPPRPWSSEWKPKD